MNHHTPERVLAQVCTFGWTSFQTEGTLTDTGQAAKQQRGAGLWHMLES